MPSYILNNQTEYLVKMIDLYKVTGIVGQAVDTLYEHYGADLEGIQQATISELKSLKGVGDHSARCAYTFFHEPAYEIWYDRNVRQIKRGDFGVLSILGKKINEILTDKFNTIEPIKDLSIEKLEKLETIVVKRTREGWRNVNIKLSPREAKKIYDYFHLTGYEFHSRPKEVRTRQEKVPEYHPLFSDEILNNTLTIILERKVKDWRKTIEDLNVFKEVIHLERFTLYHNQTNKPNEVTTQLPKILVDLDSFYHEMFDPLCKVENELYRDRTREDITNDTKYKGILDKLRAKPKLLGL